MTIVRMVSVSLICCVCSCQSVKEPLQPFVVSGDVFAIRNIAPIVVVGKVLSVTKGTHGALEASDSRVIRVIATISISSVLRGDLERESTVDATTLIVEGAQSRGGALLEFQRGRTFIWFLRRENGRLRSIVDGSGVEIRVFSGRVEVKDLASQQNVKSSIVDLLISPSLDADLELFEQGFSQSVAALIGYAESGEIIQRLLDLEGHADQRVRQLACSALAERFNVLRPCAGAGTEGGNSDVYRVARTNEELVVLQLRGDLSSIGLTGHISDIRSEVSALRLDVRSRVRGEAARCIERLFPHQGPVQFKISEPLKPNER